MSDNGLDKLTETIIDAVISKGFQNPIMYGSWVTFCDYKYDDKIPNDIDILNIVYDDYEQGHYSIKLDCIDIPVNIENITFNRLRKELYNGEIKYYTSGYGNYIPNSLNHMVTYIGFIGSTLMSRSKTEVRHICSTASDKAFNKGKKKLTVLDDYDKVLGLKNIWHSIHFIYIIKHYYLLYQSNTIQEINHAALRKEFDVLTMLEIRDNIYKIYEETVGDINDKVNAVIAYAKPIRNKLITDFRKLYPKE